jgi:hypothetical protein
MINCEKRRCERKKFQKQLRKTMLESHRLIEDSMSWIVSGVNIIWVDGMIELDSGLFDIRCQFVGELNDLHMKMITLINDLYHLFPQLFDWRDLWKEGNECETIWLFVFDEMCQLFLEWEQFEIWIDDEIRWSGFILLNPSNDSQNGSDEGWDGLIFNWIEFAEEGMWNSAWVKSIRNRDFSSKIFAMFVWSFPLSFVSSDGCWGIHAGYLHNDWYHRFWMDWCWLDELYQKHWSMKKPGLIFRDDCFDWKRRC